MGTTILASLAAFLTGAAAVGAALNLAQRRRRRRPVASVERGHDDYLAYVFHASPDAVVLVDNKDRILRANLAFTELFGYTETEAVGRTVGELIVPDGLDDQARGFTADVALGRDIGQVETVRRRKDGALVDVQILARPVTGPDGQVVVCGIYRDVTAEKLWAQRVRQLEKAVETTQVGVTVTDLEGRIIYINPADARMHGWSVDELLGRDVSVFSPQGRRRRMSHDEIRRMKSWRREAVNVRKDGSEFTVALTSDVVTDERGEPIAVVTTSEDITLRKEAEQRLRESEARYALAAAGANDVLWDWDLVTNRLYLSERWNTLLGYAEGRAIGTDPKEWLGRVHPEDLDQLQVDIAAQLQGVSPHLAHEHRIRREDDRYCWVLCRGLAVREEDGGTARMAGSMTDVTDRKLAEERLQHDAFHDGLTGLPNRALFTSLLKQAMGRALRSGRRRYAVLFLDLDRFKVVNDSLGHASGDELLIALARRLRDCVRPGDTVARLGGDEFTVLLDDIDDASDATRVADRIERELKAPFSIGGQDLFSSASIGIAFGSPSYVRPEEVIRDADLAMYRAKGQGKGRYEVFDKEMHRHAMALLRLETDLRRAAERDELRVVYQPIYELKSRRITGFEALVRWEHPERGLLGPPEFVPLAEETGMIVPIGEWVLRQATTQVREWQVRFPSDPPVTVSVNLSPRQFQQPEFATRVLEILTESGFDPRCLKLEITEGLLIDDLERYTSVIKRLATAGVQVLIDDFGTGYSSLSSLHRGNVDALKIDRSLIATLESASEHQEIVRSIVTLARSLGMTVVAEGVETERQQQYLSELDCEEVQGYLFSQAVDAAAIEKLLDSQSG